MAFCSVLRCPFLDEGAAGTDPCVCIKGCSASSIKICFRNTFQCSGKKNTALWAGLTKSTSKAVAGRKAGRQRGEILFSLLFYFTLASAFKCRDLRQIGDCPCFQACCARGEVFQTAGPGRRIGKEIKIPFHPPGQRCCASKIPL